MQAVGATRGGGHLSYVGVNHDVIIPGIELFLVGVHSAAPPQCAASCPDTIQLIWDRNIDLGKVFDLPPLDQAAVELQGHVRASRHQGSPHPLPAVLCRGQARYAAFL
ncbi:hypothetical protein [Streptomyces sp. SP18BB07]|uniref:hypothetical protein n=1 Tax=Streptomyces sp. SP18BB07 TaxID=3002522 RepID=UPI002E78E9E8|nr:hypothetical protein [Streptomyces sp. SP18BB07]MEE1765329.1 hypothetical protein [Streptomyces sp. SP18BB07]